MTDGVPEALGVEEGVGDVLLEGDWVADGVVVGLADTLTLGDAVEEGVCVALRVPVPVALRDCVWLGVPERLADDVALGV